jgi:hypothetical protein
MIFGNEFCVFFFENTYIQNYLQFVTLSFSLLPNRAESDTVTASKLALSLTDKCSLPVNTNAIPFFLAGYRSDD